MLVLLFADDGTSLTGLVYEQFAIQVERMRAHLWQCNDGELSLCTLIFSWHAD